MNFKNWSRSDMDTMRIVVREALNGNRFKNCDTMVRGFLTEFVESYYASLDDNSRKIMLETVRDMEGKINILDLEGNFVELD
jgi:hypothetical protein